MKTFMWIRILYTLKMITYDIVKNKHKDTICHFMMICDLAAIITNLQILLHYFNNPTLVKVLHVYFTQYMNLDMTLIAYL